jgi:hypothetical protein
VTFTISKPFRKPAKANIEYPIPTQGGYQLPPYPINEYTELLREKIDLLNTVLPIENEWTFGSVNKGIYISTRPYEGLDVKMVFSYCPRSINI